MASILEILGIGMTVLVPAVVWTLLGVGLFQLVRESMRRPHVVRRQVARETR